MILDPRNLRGIDERRAAETGLAFAFFACQGQTLDDLKGLALCLENAARSVRDKIKETESALLIAATNEFSMKDWHERCLAREQAIANGRRQVSKVPTEDQRAALAEF